MADNDIKDASETEQEPKDDESTAVATATAEEPEDKDEVKFVEAPIFEVDYKGNCAYEVKVTIPVANEKSESAKMLDELKHEAQVPGFRKGRAPRGLLERKFGKAIKGEVDAKLVDAAFKKLIKDKSLRPIAVPDVDGLKEAAERKEEDPLAFTMKFEVAPKVELGKYRGVKVERPVMKVADKDIDAAVAETQNRYAIYETIEGDVAAEGDQVIISFKGTVDGEAFRGGSAENYPYILGSRRVFPEFEKVLVGCSPGDDLACDVTFAEDYFNETLRGKTAKFEIKVNEVKRRSVPTLTDEFAQQAGFEDVADMRQKIADGLRAGAESRSNQLAKLRALDAVIQDSTFEIPKSLLDNIAKGHREEEVKRLVSLRVPASEVEARDEEIRKNAEEAALREIKTMVAMNEIGEAEGVEVTDEDFESTIDDLSQQTGASTEAINKYMQEEEHRNTYEDRIFRQKVLNLLLGLAEVTDVEVARDKLEQEGGEQD